MWKVPLSIFTVFNTLLRNNKLLKVYFQEISFKEREADSRLCLVNIYLYIYQESILKYVLALLFCILICVLLPYCDL